MTYSTSEEDSGNASDEDIQLAENEAWLQLCGGKMTVENLDGSVKCPFSPNRGKQCYAYRDLFQHASDTGVSNKRTAEKKGQHRALKKYMNSHLAHRAPQPVDRKFKITQELPIVDRQSCRFVTPPCVVVYNLDNGVKDHGVWSGVGDSELKRWFGPFDVQRGYALWNYDGHLGIAVLLFEKSVAGLRQAMCVERYFTDRDHGRHDYEKAKLSNTIVKGEFYGWVCDEHDLKTTPGFRSIAVQQLLKKLLAEARDLNNYVTDHSRCGAGNAKRAKLDDCRDRPEGSNAGDMSLFEKMQKDSDKEFQDRVIEDMETGKKQQEEQHGKELADVQSLLNTATERANAADLRVEELNTTLLNAQKDRDSFKKEVDELRLSLLEAEKEKNELLEKVENLKQSADVKSNEKAILDVESNEVAELELDTERGTHAIVVHSENGDGVMDTEEDLPTYDFDDILLGEGSMTSMETGRLNAKDSLGHMILSGGNCVRSASDIATFSFTLVHRNGYRSGMEEERKVGRRKVLAAQQRCAELEAKVKIYETEISVLKKAKSVLDQYENEFGNFTLAQKKNRVWRLSLASQLELENEAKSVREKALANGEGIPSIGSVDKAGILDTV